MRLLSPSPQVTPRFDSFRLVLKKAVYGLLGFLGALLFSVTSLALDPSHGFRTINVVCHPNFRGKAEVKQLLYVIAEANYYTCTKLFNDPNGAKVVIQWGFISPQHAGEFHPKTDEIFININAYKYSKDIFRDLLRHELGHAIGFLEHSPDPEHPMYYQLSQHHLDFSSLMLYYNDIQRALYGNLGICKRP